MRCARAHGDGPGPLRVRTPGVQICITLRSVLDAAFFLQPTLPSLITVCTPA